ncbi:hypothetical protein ScPMuIL_003915 [Solemya velum]
MDYDHRGRALVISIEQFPNLGLMARVDTDHDVRAACARFGALGFEVELLKDLTEDKLRRELKKASEDKRNSTVDCFVCVIFSYGDEKHICSTDNKIEIKSLMAYFKGNECPFLVQKPKLFFIQTFKEKLKMRRMPTVSPQTQKYVHFQLKRISCWCIQMCKVRHKY